jgi:hypothetical protein
MLIEQLFALCWVLQRKQDECPEEVHSIRAARRGTRSRCRRPYILVVAGSIRHITGRSVGVAEDRPLDVVLAGRGPTQQQWKP